ncbi:MAG: tail protein X [Candidatus Gastranaerophilales bacterium]|nr:tail protein X [Candidatus Gastranaerophilales bacterium]
MTEYYLYKTKKNDRWDLIADRFYGDCTDYKDIIAANPHIPIDTVIDEGIDMLIPVKEKTGQTNGLPIWKQ